MALPKRSRKEIVEYLADRRAEQFIVIQVNCGFYGESWANRFWPDEGTEIETI